MPVHDPTAANTSLWSQYLGEQWSPATDPFGQRYAVRAIAAGVAGWLTLFVAPQIAWLYGENAPAVTEFLLERGTPARDVVAVPAEFRRMETGLADERPITPASAGAAAARDLAASGAL